MNKSQKAFTLVELMVAITIFTTVAMITVSSFMMISRAQRRNNIMRESQQLQRVTIENIIRDAKNAHVVTASGSSLNLIYRFEDPVTGAITDTVVINYTLSTGRVRKTITTNGTLKSDNFIFGINLVRMSALAFTNPGNNPKLLRIVMNFREAGGGSTSLYDTDNLYYTTSLNLESVK